jgi:hypothetical protein
VALNVVQRVEHHHAWRNRNFVVHQRSAAGVAAKNAQDCFSHRYFLRSGAHRGKLQTWNLDAMLLLLRQNLF